MRTTRSGESALLLLDVLDLIDGAKGARSDAFSRAIDVPFRGATLKFIGLEDFIAMKAFAGGMDLVDAARDHCRRRGHRLRTGPPPCEAVR